MQLKNSSYVYHMSYNHGICNTTGLPFSPPIQIRSTHLEVSSKDAREVMQEGLCHKVRARLPFGAMLAGG